MIYIACSCYYYVRTYIILQFYPRSFSCGIVESAHLRLFACCGCNLGWVNPFDGSCIRLDERFILLFITVGFFAFITTNGELYCVSFIRLFNDTMSWLSCHRLFIQILEGHG